MDEGITPGWNEPDLGDPAAWDCCRLDDDALPGRATVTGSVGMKIDVQPVKGSKGAKTVNQGPEPAQLSIKVMMLNRAEVGRLEKILDKVHPRKDDKPGKPVRITHPSPNFAGVTQIRVTKVGFPQIEDDQFVWTFEAVEYFTEPKKQKDAKKKAKETGTIPGMQVPEGPGIHSWIQGIFDGHELPGAGRGTRW